MNNQNPNQKKLHPPGLKDLLNTDHYHCQVFIDSITSGSNPTKQVKLIYTNGSGEKRSHTMLLSEFVNFDSYSFVHLLRYAIHVNTESCYQDLWKIVRYYTESLTEIKQTFATKFLRLHFYNSTMDFEDFMGLVNWAYQSDRNINSESLLNGLHKQFFEYVQRMVMTFYNDKQHWRLTQEIGSDTDIDQIKLFTTCAMSACCSNHPILMAENQCLDVPFNLKKIFAYPTERLNQKIKIFQQEDSLKAVGEYVQLYLKLTDSNLYRVYLSTDFEKSDNEIVVWNFDDHEYIKSQQSYSDGFLHNLITLYQGFIKSKILNAHERRIYLRFFKGDKVIILLQSNQKASALIAQAMICFLQEILQNYPANAGNVKFNMVTFSNGQNVETNMKSTFPFDAEVKKLKQTMVTDMKPYDLCSQEQEQNPAYIRNKNLVLQNNQLRPQQQQQPQLMQQLMQQLQPQQAQAPQQNQQQPVLYLERTLEIDKVARISPSVVNKHMIFLGEIFSKYSGATILYNPPEQRQNAMNPSRPQTDMQIQTNLPNQTPLQIQNQMQQQRPLQDQESSMFMQSSRQNQDQESSMFMYSSRQEQQLSQQLRNQQNGPSKNKPITPQMQQQNSQSRLMQNIYQIQSSDEEVKNSSSIVSPSANQRSSAPKLYSGQNPSKRMKTSHMTPSKVPQEMQTPKKQADYDEDQHPIVDDDDYRLGLVGENSEAVNEAMKPQDEEVTDQTQNDSTGLHTKGSIGNSSQHQDPAGFHDKKKPQ